MNLMWLLAVRMIISGTLLTGCYYLFGHSRIRFTKKYVAVLFILAFLNVYITNIGQLWSLETLSSSEACLLYNFNPFIIMVLGYFFLEEPINRGKIIGFLCGWLGLLTSLYNNGSNSFFGLKISFSELSVITAAFATAISAIILQKMMRETSYPASTTTGFSMLLGGFFSLIHGALSAGPIFIQPPTLSFIGYIAIDTLATLVCAGLYTYLLKFYRASFVSFTGFTAPIFAAVLDRLFFGIIVSGYFYVAMFLISIGLYLFYREDKLTCPE